jgi:hypothetical protein
MRNWLDLGNFNAICDSCGLKFKASSLRKRWDGLMVCEDDYEVRHPQTLIRVPKERIAPPWTRPEVEPDTFIRSCDLWTSSPMADFGTADCATIGGNTNIPLLISVFNPRAIANLAIASRTIAGVP